ncbi:MAG: TolC family protein, partial [Bacteroidota bacterium]
MKKKSLLLTLVILTFSVLTAQQNANDQKVLTLQKAMEIALEKNYTVKQAQNNMESAQTGVTAAYGNFLPTVSLGSSWSGGAQYVNGVALGSANVRSFSPGLSAQMTLFDGFNNTATLYRAVSTSASTEYTLTRTRQSLVYRIQSDYYEVL